MDVILILFFFAIIIISYMQIGSVRIVPQISIGLSILAIYFVLMPNASTAVANSLGVGRGADLLLYIGITFGFAFTLFLFIQMRIQDQKITKLARHIAFSSARKSNQATNLFTNSAESESETRTLNELDLNSRNQLEGNPYAE